MKTSQNKQILEHLEKGKPINPLTALHEYGCFRLARVVNDLRNEGHAITTTMVEANNKRYAEYKIVVDR